MLTIFDILTNSLFICITYRFNEITLRPKFTSPEYFFLISGRNSKNLRAEILLITCITSEGDVLGSALITNMNMIS